MAVDLGAIAERLFEGVMAPLVLGGAMRPGHAIGARAALALGQGERAPIDPDLESRVQLGRVRRARRLVPVDTLAPVTPAEWAMAALLHDLMQAASPTFDAPLRRSSAVRILEVAREGIERIPEPRDVREALARHTWFARVLDVARTDTAVSWWIGSHTYLGVDPPARLTAWPDLRRVSVVATPHPLLELSPLAVDRTKLADAMARLLTRTPLTDIATCTRAAPAFTWGDAVLALAATHAGQTLAVRALSRLPAEEVDAALGRATRELLATRPAAGAPAVAILAERALADAQGRLEGGRGGHASSVSRPEVAFARGIGATAALAQIDAQPQAWSQEERGRIEEALRSVALSAAAREAAFVLAGPEADAGPPETAT
jgi:hypothetical protein